MGTISISLPDSVYCRLEDLARADSVPLNGFVTTILSQRAAIAEADSYIRRLSLNGTA